MIIKNKLNLVVYLLAFIIGFSIGVMIPIFRRGSRPESKGLSNPLTMATQESTQVDTKQSTQANASTGEEDFQSIDLNESDSQDERLERILLSEKQIEFSLTQRLIDGEFEMEVEMPKVKNKK